MINNLIKSFGFAIQGVRYCLQYEKNFRLQCFSAVLILLLCFYFNISRTEWIQILACIGSVLSFEMINTSIEKLSDKVSPSVDPLIKKVKDISAGAVFLMSAISFITSILIFFPKIKSLLF